MTRATLFLLLFLCSGVSSAQDLVGFKDINEAKLVCRKVSELFYSDSISVAFEMIREIWPMNTDEIDQWRNQTIKQLNVVEPRYGKPIAVILASERSVPKLLHELTYVVKYELHAIKIRFRFYQGKNDNWYLNSFIWDDEIKVLLDEVSNKH